MITVESNIKNTLEMEKIRQIETDEIFGNRIKKFQKLMHFKIREILLVSSIYDNYLFEEDGRLYELIRQEYQNLNLSHSPEITHVTNGKEAIEIAMNEDHFDLILTTLHIEDMHVVRFAHMVREAGINTPIILLAYDNRERKELVTQYDTSIFERIFIWQGDYHLLIGIIKYMEDRLNVENDTKTAGVQTIILVEDNVKFYSSYLPLIYTEIFKQSQRLIAEGVNLTHRFLRMRARPKILLCNTYEEAWNYYEKYESYILGIILDINFKHNGEKDSEAGIKFAQKVKAKQKDIPILLQSSNPDYMSKAQEVGASFLLKGSPMLLHHLRDFMLENFGFGDFVFQLPDGSEIGRARNLKEMIELLHLVPDESIIYHGMGNHFSKWLKARTEFWLAHKLRPAKVSDFKSVTDLRNLIIGSLKDYIEARQRGVITDFDKDNFDPKNSFARIGWGSLGGKARGLGFINTLIINYNIRDRFEDIEVFVPSAIVIATDVFDYFIEKNDLEGFALNETDDLKITQKFIASSNFPQDITGKLADFLDLVKGPLAVRSSSLLEDSQFQPFAGVYQTYMIPNSNPDKAIRLRELLQCIKSVYASTFHRKAKDYIKATSYRLEEEKMAVIIQKLIGAERNGKFYPDFSGVAKSFNFYPVPPQKSSDGIAQVALGLGKTVVEGGNTIRFCPKYPKHLLQFFSTKETIKNAQQYFFALDIKGHLEKNVHETSDMLVKKYDLHCAEEDNTLFSVASTYSPENEAVYDGTSRDGMRVVTFAPILKHGIFPLPDILDVLLNIGTWGMGTPVEIEFAVNLSDLEGHKKEFAMLQMRPLVIHRENVELEFDNIPEEDLICQSTQVLGNGVITDIHDIVFVDINKFDRSKTNETALEVSTLNSKLIKENRPYILIGIGRWGSLDPWLGIPVTWDQISGAVAIVEGGFKDMNVTPSQGSHFFQNITSFRIGYFTVNTFAHKGFIKWEWLLKQTPINETNYVKHLYFKEPVSVKISGHQNKGIILKPGK